MSTAAEGRPEGRVAVRLRAGDTPALHATLPAQGGCE